ncbi:dephospho-CoA kinase [Aquibacillus koreensis]|uniref:Dephospho-CoA kinase n=2 Tax=Aquibacillus koreensis TaxID=279446 RepID=A0A9X3WIP6_9BACI|nr:dephospho-CoA kinase [Aquibacillus koreensis]
MFKAYDIPVIDADLIAREVVEPGETAFENIIKVFGEDLIDVNQQLNRKKLGQIVFSDKEKLEQLNQIVHPAIRERMIERKKELLEQGATTIVFDIPLLFEKNLTFLVEKTLVVYVDESIQLKRLMDRDQSSEEEALKRIQSQIPTKEKAKMADEVIDNSGTIDESRRQLEDILRKWNVI